MSNKVKDAKIKVVDYGLPTVNAIESIEGVYEAPKEEPQSEVKKVMTDLFESFGEIFSDTNLVDFQGFNKKTGQWER